MAHYDKYNNILKVLLRFNAEDGIKYEQESQLGAKMRYMKIPRFMLQEIGDRDYTLVLLECKDRELLLEKGSKIRMPLFNAYTLII